MVLSSFRLPCFWSCLPLAGPCRHVRFWKRSGRVLRGSFLRGGKFRLRFFDGEACVVFRVAFLAAAEVGEPADNFLGIVAARQGAFRVDPIPFGLAQGPRVRGAVCWEAIMSLQAVVDRFGAHTKIVEMIDTIGVPFCPHTEFRVVLAVEEPWETQDARRVGCRGIASKFPRHGPEEPFGLFLPHSFDPPNDLKLLRRSVDGVVGSRHKIRLPNSCESRRTVVIDVEIKMADGLDVLLGARARFRLQGVHSDVDVVGFLFILVMEPVLRGSARNSFHGCDALDRLTAIAIADQNGNTVGRVEVSADVLYGGDFFGSFAQRSSHWGTSCFW